MTNDFYSYSMEESNRKISYNFTTVNGISIQLEFKPDQYKDYVSNYPTLLNHGFGINLHSESTLSVTEKVVDTKLKNTISKIILDFLDSQGNETILLYHCDISDTRQALRNRKFNQWYDSNPDNDKVIKETIELISYLPDEISYSFYMGYLTSIENKNNGLARAEYEEFATKIANNNK